MNRKTLRRIFLSTVTSEFGEHRQMLKGDLSLPNVKVQEQSEFAQGPGKLLQTLDTYIRDHCDAVIHVIGTQRGAPIKQPEIHWLLEEYPNFLQKFPELAEDLGMSPPALSYTQIEAWLALYHGKACCIYRESQFDDETLEHSQRKHWRRITERGEHYTLFDDTQHLCRQVLRDLYALFPNEIPYRPIILPFPPLGTLFKGRESSLQQLWESLSSPAGQPMAITGKAVHGLGGVGKTRLAVEFAWAHRDDYSALLFLPPTHRRVWTGTWPSWSDHLH